jgi:hypothetical protein
VGITGLRNMFEISFPRPGDKDRHKFHARECCSQRGTRDCNGAETERNERAGIGSVLQNIHNAVKLRLHRYIIDSRPRQNESFSIK